MLYDSIEDRNNDYNATIFTYTMGGDSTLAEVAHYIACTNKGIWVNIPDDSSEDEVVTAMAGYY